MLTKSDLIKALESAQDDDVVCIVLGLEDEDGDYFEIHESVLKIVLSNGLITITTGYNNG